MSRVHLFNFFFCVAQSVVAYLAIKRRRHAPNRRASECGKLLRLGLHNSTSLEIRYGCLIDRSWSGAMLQSEKTTEQQGRRGNIFIGSVFGMLFSSITSHRCSPSSSTSLGPSWPRRVGARSVRPNGRVA